MNKFFSVLVAAAFILLSQVTSAGRIVPEPVNTNRLYRVYWSGLHIADLRANITENGFEAFVQSYGIAKKISKYSSKFKATFDVNENQYTPRSYYTEFWQRNGGRKIDIKYNTSGQINEETVTPPDNRAKRPAVSEDAKHNSVDPLTAVLTARNKIRENMALGNEKFSFNIYDGRRLARLDFNINGREKREIRGREHKIVKVTVKRHPLEGFTNNELRRLKDEEPVFTLYLSDDKHLLPIKVYADAPIGTAVLLLEKLCSSSEECV